jgi:hypothetical protein
MQTANHQEKKLEKIRSFARFSVKIHMFRYEAKLA